MKSTPTLSSLASLYLFRVLHIGSMIGVSYKIINDYLNDTLSTDHAAVFAVLGVVAMASGLINTFLLQPKKMGEQRKLWISWNHIKLLITLILFSPIYKYLPIASGELISLRFYWLMVVILVSPAARFYREFWVKKN